MGSIHHGWHRSSILRTCLGSSFHCLEEMPEIIAGTRRENTERKEK
jgi:hypothetical protein